jgi:hypothetical protein
LFLSDFHPSGFGGYMAKISPRTTLMAVAATAVLALPGAAQAGHRHDDCLHKVFRDVDRSMTRVVTPVDHGMRRMFRWCDRHRK